MPVDAIGGDVQLAAPKPFHVRVPLEHAIPRLDPLELSSFVRPELLVIQLGLPIDPGRGDLAATANAGSGGNFLFSWRRTSIVAHSSSLGVAEDQRGGYGVLRLSRPVASSRHMPAMAARPGRNFWRLSDWAEPLEPRAQWRTCHFRGAPANASHCSAPTGRARQPFCACSPVYQPSDGSASLSGLPLPGGALTPLANRPGVTQTRLYEALSARENVVLCRPTLWDSRFGTCDSALDRMSMRSCRHGSAFTQSRHATARLDRASDWYTPLSSCWPTIRTRNWTTAARAPSPRSCVSSPRRGTAVIMSPHNIVEGLSLATHRRS